jgi:hypothetical protein
MNGTTDGKINGTWRIAGVGIGGLTLVLIIMGLTFRVHSATPHDKAVSESEFQVFLQQDIEQMKAIREDLREIRLCMTRYLAGDHTDE